MRNRNHTRLLIALTLVACFTLVGFAANGASEHPMTLADILAWKRIQTPVITADGAFFAYRLTPAEGNAEVIVRNLKTGKEDRYPAGDRVASTPPPPAGAPPNPAAAAAGAGGGPTFSDDGKWVAFTAYPLTRDAKRMRRDRRPIQTKVVLVELATGKKVEFEKTRRFAFSGENSTTIALQRYGAEAAATPAAGAAAPAGGTGAPAAGAGGATPPERASGSDLLLYELATGSEMSVGNVSEFAFDKKGDYLAWIVDAQDKAGNGIELRKMNNGAVQVLDSAAASYKGLTWTEKGDALAAVRGVDDKGFEDKLYSLVAFKDFSGAKVTKVAFDPKEDAGFPKGMTISPNRNPAWRENLSAVTFGIHEVKPKKSTPNAREASGEGEAPAPPARPADPGPDQPSLVLWHYKDSRLQTQQQVQENADKNFSFLCEYIPAEKKFLRLADESMRQVTMTAEDKMGVGVDVREYERMSNLDGRRLEDVYVVDPATGQRKLALKKAAHMFNESPDGTKFLYYDDGQFFTYDMASGKTINLTAKVPTTFIDVEDDHNVVKPPRQPFGWSKDSNNVLLSDGWDIWKVAADGSAAVNLTVNGKKDQIRYRRPFRLDSDDSPAPGAGRGGFGGADKGTDLKEPLYVGAFAEWTKKGGIGRIEPDQPGVKMLQWDDAEFTTLLKAKHADVYLYTRENYKEYPDFRVSDANLSAGTKITDADPQVKNLAWTSGVKIVNYTSDKGDKLQGALWLPANYEPGKKYPMITYIYEKLTQATNQFPQPAYNGSNIAHYTSNGYAFFEPDIVYKVNDPGMSAVWCVVPAVKAAIATGIVDPAKIGLHGHSWGGYQTAFLVTQTDIFHAAVAGAPLTDMVSMYSLIYKNTGGGNGAIFEASQGRFKGGYWENMDSYVRNSPIFSAAKVKTPLIILHNDRDGAVDQTQGIEYFNTLRRMGKPVVLLEYKGENHGLARPENMKDYTVRMREFFDHYLKDQPAPKWLEEGVPMLKMKEHLEDYTKALTAAPGEK
jgi:dipeptidyl aminopeptidase/acylaminoacyl peptidase